MKRGILTGFIEYAERRQLNLHGVIALQADEVLGQHFWIDDTPHELRSISKSFTSCAIGIAIAERRLTIDSRLIDIFAGDLAGYSDERIKNLTIRHLLTMSHGRDEAIMMSHQRPFIDEPDWLNYFFLAPLDRPPGERFVYDTGATYVLSAAIEKVSGQTLRSYLMPRLFEPLGIIGVTCLNRGDFLVIDLTALVELEYFFCRVGSNGLARQCQSVLKFRELPVVELFGFHQDVLAHTNLAKIVQERCVTQLAQPSIGGFKPNQVAAIGVG